MLEFVQSLAKRRRLPRRSLRRKYRLFAVACRRCVWDRMDPPYDECVELAERYADGADPTAGPPVVPRPQGTHREPRQKTRSPAGVRLCLSGDTLGPSVGEAQKQLLENQ
jgi:hypothetical protein